MAFEKLEKDDVADLLGKAAEDAVLYVDGELSASRAKATQYYLGEPFGNEEDGRSQMVLTEVRDAISGMLPSVLRVLNGGERVVEFVPPSPDKAKQAEQVTDYLNKVLDRAGWFLKAHSVMLDGFVRAMGVVKWGYDNTPTLKHYCLYQVTESELEALGNEDGVTVTSAKLTKAEVKPTFLPPQPQPPAQPGQPPMPPAQPQLDPNAPPPSEAEYTVEFNRKKDDGQFRLWAVPPEEFLFSREARDVEDATLVGHRTNKKASDLVAMGVSEEILDEYGRGGEDYRLLNSRENTARREVLSESEMLDAPAGEASEDIMFAELYFRVDTDGDGIRELRKFQCIGPKYYVINGDGLGEPVNSAPFAIFCPYPEPHTIAGQSVYSRVGDMQLYKSMIVRSMSDSLALTLYPRLGILEGQVNQGDVLNTDIGAPIRMRTLGAVQPITHDFVGREALGVLSLADEIIERRTGQSRGATGLDADALQSTTQEGVGAQLALSQQQIELICRVFAETLLKPLMKGLYDLYVTWRPKAETVRLRGQWVEMDPRQWDEELDVDVKIALGTTDATKKIAYLTAVHQEQSGIIAQYGLDNPLCGLPELRNTIDEISRLSGYIDSTPFFKPIGPNFQPPPPQQPKPSPAEIQVQGELQLAAHRDQRELAIKEAELEFKREQAEKDRQIELAKLAQDFTLRRYAIDAQFKSTYTQQQLEQDAARDQQAIEGHIALQDQAHQHAVDAHNQAMAQQQQQVQQAQDAQAQQHAQQLAEQQAAQQAAPAPSEGATA